MSLSFLPPHIKAALDHLNINFVSEIRLRQGKPVTVCYLGKYGYLDSYGITSRRDNALICKDVQAVVDAASGGSLYSYTEQIKKGFITCGHGIRIGIAGQYITQNGCVTAMANITSLNIRIPHAVEGCARFICNKLFLNGLCSLLVFSKPGLGKTTLLRDIAKFLSDTKLQNVLVFDERCEISAMDENGEGFDLGDRTDVIRSGNKLAAVESAVRSMRPDVIITDELHGEGDMRAVSYARECGIDIIASSHVTDRRLLRGMPFEYFAELKAMGGRQVIYDKNFDTYCDSLFDDGDGGVAGGR